jgi:hypothetical protein
VKKIRKESCGLAFQVNALQDKGASLGSPPFNFKKKLNLTLLKIVSIQTICTSIDNDIIYGY